MSIWRFASRFSTTPAAFQITLGEGDTPLIRSRRIGPAAGLNNLWFKLETANPTGSYKDRFGAAAIADMQATGLTRCVATSSGNTGSALAAYCAAAGMACDIAVIETAPEDKLRQMMAYGAHIYRVKGFGLDIAITTKAFQYVLDQGKAPGASVQVSAYAVSPVGMAGVQTIAYELAEQAAANEINIDHVFVPAGGGGLTLAIARGFVDLVSAGDLSRSPRIECVQPHGNDTIAGPLRDGAEQARAVECATAIGGLQVATVIDGHDTLAACRASGGNGHRVTDEDVWAMQARLAREEGVFCEPASAVPVVGAINAAAAGEIDPDAHVVCIITGIGFKDERAITRMLDGQTCPTTTLEALQDKA